MRRLLTYMNQRIKTLRSETATAQTQELQNA